MKVGKLKNLLENIPDDINVLLYINGDQYENTLVGYWPENKDVILVGKRFSESTRAKRTPREMPRSSRGGS